jgi:glucokinase
MRSFLYISSGFGMGMVLDGRLYRGSQTQAGEISYVQMNERGPRGFDGREGLLIDVAPFYRVTDRLEEIVEANGDTLLRNYMQPGSKGISVEMAAQAAGAGDMLCAELIGENFKIVSRLAVNLAYIFNPEAMIFDKWTSFCESCTLDVVRRHMGHYGVRHWGLKTQILSAACGEESLAGGSAMIPLDVFFEVDGFERVNKSHSKGRSAAL